MSTPQSQIDPYSDILTAATGKANKPRTRGRLSDLTTFAEDQNLAVGSTTGGHHNRGSKHYSGNAVDIHNSGSMSDEQVAALSQTASDYGFKVRDERMRPKGQKVWGGPHVHIETDDNDPYKDILSLAQSPQPSIVDALSNETTKVQRVTNRMMRKLPASQQSTPRSLAGTTTTPMRRREDLTTGSVPNLQDIVTSARENPDPTAARNTAIRDKVISERYPTTMSGMIGRNFERATAPFLHPIDTAYNATASDSDIISEETNRRIEQADRANTPEMVEQRKDFGRMPAAERTVLAPTQRFGAGLLKSAAGVMDVDTSGLVGIARAVGLQPDRLKDYLNQRGQLLEEGSTYAPLNEAGEEVKRGIPEKVVTAVGDLGYTVAQLAVMKQASGLSLTKLLAIETALKTSDLPVRERAAKVAESAAMGRILDGHLSRSASAALFGAPTAVQSGTSYLQGNTSGTDALLNTAVQAGAGAILGGKPKPIGETLTRVPDIEATLRARAEKVSSYAQPKDIESQTPAMDRAINPTPQVTEAPLPQSVEAGAGNVPVDATGDVRGVSIEQPHPSVNQPRRARNTEHGKRGQFKSGKLEAEPSTTEPHDFAYFKAQGLSNVEAAARAAAEHRAFTESSQKGAPPNDVAAISSPTLANEPQLESTKATEGVGQLAPSESLSKELKGTKVADDNGNPIVVYHGSPSGKIESFDTAKTTTGMKGANEDPTRGLFFFAKHKMVADSYVEANGGEGESHPYYLDLKNPYEIDAKGQEWTETHWDAIRHATEMLVPEMKEVRAIHDKVNPHGQLDFEDYPVEAQSAIKQLANQAESNILNKREGAKVRATEHDGIIIRNARDSAGGEALNQPTDIYIAFHPEQIKSAAPIPEPQTQQSSTQPPVPPASPSTSVPAVEQSAAPVPEKHVEGWHFSRTAAEAQKILKEGFNPKFQSKDVEYPDPANGVWIGTGEPEYLDRIPGMKERGLSISAKLRPIKFETPQDLYDFVDPLVGRKLGNVHVSEVSRRDPLLKPANRQKVSDALLAKGYNAIEIGEGFRGASPHRPGDYLIIDPSLAKDVRPYGQDVTTPAPASERVDNGDTDTLLRFLQENGPTPIMDAAEKLQWDGDRISVAFARLEVADRAKLQARKVIAANTELPIPDRRGTARIPDADWSTMTPAEQTRTRQQLEVEMGGPATHEGGVRIGASEPRVEPDTKPSVTSARKADLSVDRAELDLPELPQSERKGWQTSLDNAKSRGLDQQANRIADEVLKSLRALNDEETAGMVLRLQQVKNEHAGLLKQVGEGDAEQQAVTRARLQTVEDEFDKLDTATKKSGTEKGRTLAAQKLTINQDFDLISLIQRAKARGIEITPSRRQKYADMVMKVGELETQLAQAREDNATKSVQQQIDSVRRKSNRQVRKGEITAQREAIKQSITAEITRLKEQSKQGQFLSQGGLGNLDPEGVITRNLVKYAKTLIDEGVLKAEDVIDRVHELVKDYGATRRQTAEALSGYGIGDNKAKLESELARIRREIRETLGQQDVETGRLTSRRAGPRQSEASRSGIPTQGPRLSDVRRLPAAGPKLSDANRLPAQGPRITDAPFVGPRASDVNRLRPEGPNIASKGQNETRVRQLEKQAREIEQKIANKDYSPTVKREPVIYDAKSNRIQSQVEALKRQYQADLDANEKKTIGDYLVRWKRFAVLTYPTTFGKLATAAASRMSLSPVEELSDLALSRVPGFKQVARQSSMGQPSMKAEAKAIRQIWEGGETNGFKQTLEYLKTGHDMLDLLYGGKHADEFRSGDKILGAPGRAHGAVKEIPKRAAFYRSFEKRLALAEKQGADIADPRVQLAKAGEAYVDAQRAVLQQDNPVSKAFSQWVGGMERSKSGTMQAAGKALRFTFPITRVPVNFAGEAAMNIAGVPYAAVRTGIRAMQGKLNDLSPMEADHIRRAYKIGGVGAAFLTWGILKPDQFGGYYQPGKRDESDLKAGEMKLFGQRLPRWLAHTPQLEAAQFGATIRRTFDKLRAKHPETSKTEAGIVGTATAAKGLGEEIPFVQPLLDSERGLGSLFTHPGKFAANQIKGAIPGAVQWGARRLDTDTGNPVTGTTVSRPTHGFLDTLEEGIPGLRNKIPISSVFGSKSTKASSEVQQSGIQLRGASKQPDETFAEFKDRQSTQNDAIRSAIENLVDNPRYDTLSPDEKREQIKMVIHDAVQSLPKRESKEKKVKPEKISMTPSKRALHNYA